jgi:hypothetical protein
MTSAFCSIALGAKLGSPKRGFYIDHAIRFHEKVLSSLSGYASQMRKHSKSPRWQRFSNWQGALRMLPLPAC